MGDYCEIQTWSLQIGVGVNGGEKGEGGCDLRFRWVVHFLSRSSGGQVKYNGRIQVADISRAVANPEYLGTQFETLLWSNCKKAGKGEDFEREKLQLLGLM